MSTWHLEWINFVLAAFFAEYLQGDIHTIDNLHMGQKILKVIWKGSRILINGAE